MLAVARCAREETRTVGVHPPPERVLPMNSIIYIVGVIVIIGFILGYFGLR
jgi:hypothetical protein